MSANLHRSAPALVRVTFDARGLARVVESEDGMTCVEYLEDPARVTEYARPGDLEWLSPLDYEELVA